MNDAYDEEVVVLEKKEEIPIMVDLKLFVSYQTYIRVKYGITDLKEFLGHKEIGVVSGQCPGAKDIMARLAAAKQLTEDVTESIKMDIMSSNTYIDYTNESGTVVLTLEKMFQVCARIFVGFKIGKKDLVTIASYQHDGVLIENQPITELIKFVTELYAIRGKKMVMEGNVTTYFELTTKLLIKKYKDALPSYMNRFFIQFKSELELFDVPTYMSSTAIEMLCSMIVDTSNSKVELNLETEEVVRTEVTYNTSVIHEVDRQISKQITIMPEIESFVTALVATNAIKMEVADEAVAYIKETSENTDMQLKSGAMDRDLSVMNAGWLTITKNPSTEIDRMNATYATRMVEYLGTEPHFYIYCPITYDFIRIRHKNGIKVLTAPHLEVVFRALKKMFHFSAHLIYFCKKDYGDIIAFIKRVISSVANLLGPGQQARSRYQRLLELNFMVWTRTVEIERFGGIKDSYLPSLVMSSILYDEIDEENDLLIEI